MDIKLIVTDLDNTLLRRDKSLSDYTLSIIGQCRTKGILIAFATARSERDKGPFSDQVTPDIFISNNGALARRGSEMLFTSLLPADAAHELIQKCREEPRILTIRLETENEVYANSTVNPTIGDIGVTVITDFAQDVDYSNSYKISIRCNDENVPAAIARKFPAIDIIGYREENFFTFRSREASKENALFAIAGLLGINMGNIAAFGDDVSDIGMLKASGIAVAVENAVPAVKAAAEYICGDCDEDGVARWIEANLLGA